MPQYKIYFKDKFGEETTYCDSDGSILTMTLRGEVFSGLFSMLEAENKHIEPGKFDLDGNNYIQHSFFRMEFPVLVEIDNQELEVPAVIEFDYRNGNDVAMELTLNNVTYRTTKKYSCSENAIMYIQRQLPQGCELKLCLSCRYSNYHPVGNDDFGCLYCFRNAKKQTETIKDKASLFRVWDAAVAEKKLFSVQETFLCNSFERLKPDDWCYKSW